MEQMVFDRESIKTEPRFVAIDLKEMRVIASCDDALGFSDAVKASAEKYGVVNETPTKQTGQIGEEKCPQCKNGPLSYIVQKQSKYKLTDFVGGCPYCGYMIYAPTIQSAEAKLRAMNK